MESGNDSTRQPHTWYVRTRNNSKRKKGSDYRWAPGPAVLSRPGQAPDTHRPAEPSAGADSQGQLHQGAASVAAAASQAPRQLALLPSVPQAPLPAAKPAPAPNYRPGTQFGLS